MTFGLHPYNFRPGLAVAWGGGAASFPPPPGLFLLRSLLNASISAVSFSDAAIFFLVRSDLGLRLDRRLLLLGEASRLNGVVLRRLVGLFLVNLPPCNIHGCCRLGPTASGDLRQAYWLAGGPKHLDLLQA